MNSTTTQAAATAEKSPRIYTSCPACHNDTLTVNADKHLLCTWIDCPNPTLIHNIDSRVRPLVDALKFYAGNFPNDDLVNWQERVCNDEGDKARAVLATVSPEESGEVATPKVNPFERTPRDWTEDFNHENGNYSNTCHICQQAFTGHKRRMVCKACSQLPPIGPDPRANGEMVFKADVHPAPSAAICSRPECIVMTTHYEREHPDCVHHRPELLAPSADEGTPETKGVMICLREALYEPNGYERTKALEEAIENGVKSLERRLSAALAERDKWKRRFEEKEKPAIVLGKEVERLTKELAKVKEEKALAVTNLAHADAKIEELQAYIRTNTK